MACFDDGAFGCNMLYVDGAFDGACCARVVVVDVVVIRGGMSDGVTVTVSVAALDVGVGVDVDVDVAFAFAVSVSNTKLLLLLLLLVLVS